MPGKRRRHVDDLLTDWQSVMLVTSGSGLGFSSSTSIARAHKGELTHSGRPGSRLPAHADLPGLAGFLTVERALRGFSARYRETLVVELVEPCAVVGMTQKARATWLGVPLNTYARRLARLREALRDAV